MFSAFIKQFFGFQVDKVKDLATHLSKEDIQVFNVKGIFELQLESSIPQIWVDDLVLDSSVSPVQEKELHSFIEKEIKHDYVFLPEKSEGDVVLYTSYNFYLLLRFFFTAYERILFS